MKVYVFFESLICIRNEKCGLCVCVGEGGYREIGSEGSDASHQFKVL